MSTGKHLEVGFAWSAEESGPGELVDQAILVCLHPIGPDQSGWLNFWEREVLPNWQGSVVGSGAG